MSNLAISQACESVSCSFLHAPGTSSNSCLLLCVPVGAHQISGLCAAVSGLMWAKEIHTETMRLVQQALCPLSHLDTPFLGSLGVKLTGSEMCKPFVPCFSEFDLCRPGPCDTVFIHDPLSTPQSASASLLHSVPSPLPGTSTAMHTFTVRGFTELRCLKSSVPPQDLKM